MADFLTRFNAFTQKITKYSVPCNDVECKVAGVLMRHVDYDR